VSLGGCVSERPNKKETGEWEGGGEETNEKRRVSCSEVATKWASKKEKSKISDARKVNEKEGEFEGTGMTRGGVGKNRKRRKREERVEVSNASQVGDEGAKWTKGKEGKGRERGEETK
jgi:hypothetical protein